MRLIGLCGLALTIACGATSSVTNSGDPHCYLVWTQTGEEPSTSEVCDGDREARPSEPGTALLIDGVRRSLVVREVQADAWTCDFDRAPSARPEPGTAVVGRTLELQGEDGRVTTLLALPELDELEELVDEIEVLTTLGPYLAVCRSTSTRHACGAHAYRQVTYPWFDLRTGEVFDLLPSIALDRDEAVARLTPWVQAEAPELLSWNAGIGPDANASEDAAWLSAVRDCMRFEGAVPHWDGARWRVQPRAVCSIGDAFEPIETLLPPAPLPPPLDSWQPPPAVARFIASTPGVSHFGFGARR